MFQRLAVCVTVVAAAACGGNNNHNTVDSGGGKDTGGGGADAAQMHVGSGVFTVPMTTPSGDDQGFDYNVDVTASGTTFSVILDTGSTTVALAGSACSACTGVTPLYMPGTGAKDTSGSDSQSYEDGTGWSGEIFEDDLTVGNGLPAEPVKFVDIDAQQMDFFDANEWQGIMGFATADLLDPGETAYFDTLIADGMTPIASFELCPTGGTMWLGGVDATHATGDFQQVTLLTGSADNAAYYSIDLTAMSLGSADLGATEASLDGPVIDTGTSLTYIPTAAETAFLKDLNGNANFKTLFGSGAKLDTSDSGSCITPPTSVSDQMVDTMLPALTMSANGPNGPVELTAPALGSYLYDDGAGDFCLAMFDGGDDGDGTLGDTFMRAFVIVIDRGASQVGFAPTATCPVPDVVQPHVAGGVVAPHKPREVGRGPHRHHGRSR